MQPAEIAKPFFCPRCQGPAPEFEVESGLRVNFCNGCRSIWLDAGELATYLGVPSDLPDEAISVAHSEESDYRCPHCYSQLLLNLPYTIDSFLFQMCPNCKGLCVSHADLATARAIWGVAREVLRPANTTTAAPELDESPIAVQDYDRIATPIPYWNRSINLFTLPCTLLLVLLVRQIFPLDFFLRFFVVQFHEFGHATHAWICSYFAMPLPYGLTVTGNQWSWGIFFTIAGMATGAGYYLWRTGYRIAAAPFFLWVLLQTFFTFTRTHDQQEEIFVLGGGHGEILLPMLGMLLFHIEFPPLLRMDFWRFPILFISTFGFVTSWRFWLGVAAGKNGLPRGSMLQGEEDANGDIDRLINQFGWSGQQITHFFTQRGWICFWTLVGVYLFVLALQFTVMRQTKQTQANPEA